MSVVKIKAHDGTAVSFEDTIIGQGGMKDVYFAPDRSYVVAFFRKPQDHVAKQRLDLIVGKYREGIFNGLGGEFWKGVYCWPTAIVDYNGRLGLVAPTYDRRFFFEHGALNNDGLKIKGKEKEGKWFATAKLQNMHLDPRERGDWLKYLKISLNISRAVRRMHAAGLAHSDLSYKNVLVDPVSGSAALIDIDGLVVPGRFPPDVVGTPDFVAPEVMRTLKLAATDPRKALPRRETDQHALAVLIYMYLLYRHPLKGRKIWDADDSARDEELAMGEKAHFIEHANDKSNRPNRKWLEANETPRNLLASLPFADPDEVPYSVLGPYLKERMDDAFVAGLHDPTRRPSASDWETALIKTADIVLACSNPKCIQRYFVYDNTLRPACPFCKAKYANTIPVFDLYSNRGGSYKPDNHRLIGYHNQYIFKWHMNSAVWPNEKLTEADRKPVGYIAFHQGRWMLVNQAMPGLRNVTTKTPIPIGQGVELTQGLQLLFDPELGGRLANVQVAG